MKKVWILDNEGLAHDKEFEVYKENNIEYRLTTKKSFEQDLDEFGKYTDAIVAQVGFQVDARLIGRLKNCKVICTFGMGFNHVDLVATKDKGIYVCNIPDYCKEEVADHTLALSLTLLRRLPLYNRKVKNGDWDPLLTQSVHRLSNVVVGLLGFGQIARDVARRFRAFGMEIIAHDKFVNKEIFKSFAVKPVTLEELLEKSQLLSLHVPLTKETENLLDYDKMRKLPKGAIVINTCRGGIINEDDLAKLIKEQHLSAAGLDVLKTEPPQLSNPLLQLDDVIISPHAAYYSIEAEEEMQIRTAQNVVRVLKGKKPLHIVNGLTKNNFQTS